MQTGKNITVIPASRDIITGIPKSVTVKKKVAAYARVSTDSEEQQTSYEAQVDYYTNYIKAKPEWQYVDTYTDEGISGMMTKNRSGFNRMIADALAGRIDLIITKSVSRFARNTVDSLTTIRKLKEKGVEVYFEKENIYSLDSKGELMLTLMSSLAQEESRSLSQNVTWGQRKRFSDGKVSIPYKQFLGYRKGADGNPEIIPEEAAVVRRIYHDYMQGKSVHVIAKGLTADGIPTPRKKSVWSRSTVESILKNEKYKGDALLQKTFTTDFLTKKMKVNEGEVPQYYVTGSHPAIIEPIEWNLVQLEIEKRDRDKNYSSTKFAGRIFCGDCGCTYGPKVWHSQDRYKRTIWQCNDKFKGEKCHTTHLDEDRIEEMFSEALTLYFEQKDELLSELKMLKDSCLDTDKVQKSISKVQQDMEITASALKQCISENASASVSEDEFREKYDSLYDKFKALEKKHDRLSEKLTNLQIESAALDEVIHCLESSAILPFGFDPMLWRILVEKVTVYSDDHVVFKMAGERGYGFWV